MLNEEGGVIDDLIICALRLDDAFFRLVVNAATRRTWRGSVPVPRRSTWRSAGVPTSP